MTLPGGLLSTADAARALGVSPRRLLALSASRGVEGLRVGRARLWAPADVRALAPGAPGRPKKNAPTP